MVGDKAWLAVGVPTRVSDEVDVRALCRPAKFFYTKPRKPFLPRPSFVHRGIVMLKQVRVSSKLLPQG